MNCASGVGPVACVTALRLMVKVTTGVAVEVLTTVGPPDEPPDVPEPPLVEVVPGPPEGTRRSSSCSNRRTTLRRLGDAWRWFTEAPCWTIQPVNRDHNVMTSSLVGPPGPGR